MIKLLQELTENNFPTHFGNFIITKNYGTYLSSNIFLSSFNLVDDSL